MRRYPALLAAAALSACSPEPRWIAFAHTQPPSIEIAHLPLRDGSQSTVTLTGSRASALLFNADGASLYVVSPNGSVAYRRRADGALLAEARFADAVADLRLDARRQRLLVLAGDSLYQREAGSLAAVTALYLCDAPRGFAVVGSGDRGYATCAGDAVAVIDLQLGRIARVASLVAAPACDAGPPALARDESVLALPCRVRSAVLLVDRVTLRVTADIALPAPAQAVVGGAQGLHALALMSSGAAALDLTRRRAVPLALDGRPIAAVPDWRPGRMRVLVGRTPPDQDATTELLTIRLRDGAVERAWSAGSAIAFDIWPRERSPIMWWRR